MRKILLLSVLCAGMLSAQAQEVYNSSGRAGQAKYKQNQAKKGFDINRMVFGGGIGLAFGDITNIYIAPSVGYRITDNLAAGISLGYNYYRQKDAFLTYNKNSGEQKTMPFTQSVYTGSVWGRYLIIPNIMVQAEFEVNNIGFYDFDAPTVFDKDGWAQYQKNRVTIPSLLLGGGYRQPIADYASLFVIAMYDVLQNIPSNMRTDQNGNKYSISPYARRVDVRFGFMIGF